MSTASRPGAVFVRVEWVSKTRSRSHQTAGAGPASSGDARVALSETCTVKALIDACVQLPPGVDMRDGTTLRWGNTLLENERAVHGTEDSGWVVDVFADDPVRLTLTVPPGTLVRHPALVQKLKGQRCVPMEMMSDAKELLREFDEDAETMETGSGDGSMTVIEPSLRALHPGRTCEHDVSALMMDHGAVLDATGNGGAIVDVGSGCGSLAAGLAKAFPKANVCGIECQGDLVEQARQKFPHVNFIHNKAEHALHTCRGATCVLATTHNFDYETTNYILRICAELPLLTHLIVNEPHLCRPACRTKLKFCCCFELLETRKIKTHWGNSYLSFSIYKRHVRWPFGSASLPRGVDVAVALMENNVEALFLNKDDDEDIPTTAIVA